VLITLAALTTSALGQVPNLPPPGAYQPIPNFTGVGAGLLFRKAINDRFSGAQPIAPSMISIAFADLGDEQDAMELYCNDCQATTPCTGGGAGAWAFGERGVWNCVAGSYDQTTGGDLSGLFSNATVNTVQGGKTPVTAGYTGALSLTGNSGNGSDQISGASVNGAINPRAYGAVGLKTASACSTSVNSNLVTITPKADFQNGQTVMCAHAGLPSTATAPSALTVLATDPSGTGATTWTYNTCTFDAVTGQMSGCTSAFITNTPALNSNLSGNNNLLHWTGGANGTATAIYNQTGLIGLIPIGVTSFRDVGQAVETFNELPTTPPSSALNQRLSTTISTGGGTTSLVLASAATPAVSGQFFSHDDTVAIQAAFAAAQAQGKPLHFPPGSYNYFGAGLAPTTAAFSINGEPPLAGSVSDATGSAGQSIVFLSAGGSFINDSATLVQMQLRDMTIVGGMNQVRLTGTGSVGYGQKEILGNAFLSFTGCGLCSQGLNAPYFRVERNMFVGLDVNATTGLGMSFGNDASSINNNTFNSLRIGIADAGRGFGRSYNNNDFISGIARQPFSRIDMWFSQNSGGNAKIDSFRAGADGLMAGDYRILDADDDGAALIGERFPVAPHANYGTGEIVLDGAITTGTAALTSNTAHFLTSAHAGDWVRVQGAGKQGACMCELVAQVNSINGDVQVTLNSQATATVSGATVFFGAASNQTLFQGITLVNSWFTGVPGGSNPTIPWIYTTNRTMSGWSLLNNFNNANLPMVQYLPSIANSSLAHINIISGTYGTGLGINSSTDTTPPINEADAFVINDPAQRIPTWSQPSTFQETVDSSGVTDALASTPINSFTASAGTATLAAITDRAGGTDAAEITIAAPGTAAFYASFTPPTTGLYWLSFDGKKANTGTPVGHINSAISSSTSGACFLDANDWRGGGQRAMPQTGGWTTYNFPFLAKDTTTPLRVCFETSTTNSVRETGTFDIGQVHVYQHETPVDFGAITLANSAFFNKTWSLKTNVVTYGASMTPDLSKGAVQSITITNGSAFTIQNPIGIPPQGGYFPNWTLYLKNSSGGAAGAITLGLAFSPTGAGAIAAPANGAAAIYHFGYDGTVHLLNTGVATASGSVVTMTGDDSGPSNANTVTKVNNNTPGNTCTNQFTRSIDSSARGTCATITNADLTALASPPAIGNTTPAAGSFTTLKLSTFTVAGLPTCDAGADATYVTVTDATAVSCVGGSVIVGGSTNYCLAICKNGIGWVNP